MRCCLIKPKTSKLLKLKKWLTLSEAAKHLSGICGEEVTEADILRLALDDYLKISVYFVNGTLANPGYKICISEGRRRVYYDDENYHQAIKLFATAFSKSPKNLPNVNLTKEQNESLDKRKTLREIHGVWDLAMVESELLDLEHKWQMLTGGPSVTLESMEGTFVENDKGEVYQLQEDYDKNAYMKGTIAELEYIKDFISNNQLNSDQAQELLNQHKEDRKKYLEDRASKPYEANFYPAGGLPDDSVLVIRTDALREFEQYLNDFEDKPLQPKMIHGNTEINAKKREEVLGAALAVLAKWPNECRAGSGNIKATKIRELIESKGYLFWREDGEPPLKTSEIENLIREWLKKTGE